MVAPLLLIAALAPLATALPQIMDSGAQRDIGYIGAFGDILNSKFSLLAIGVVVLFFLAIIGGAIFT